MRVRPIFSTAVLIGAAVLLSACGGMPASTPPPIRVVFPTDAQAGRLGTEVAAALTGTASFATPTPDDRPTLPPTWTPTLTATPAPPTATVTLSPTPTLKPTLSAEAICDAFYVTHNLPSGQILAWDSKVTLYVYALPSDATVRFLAVHHFSGENRGADLPGGQSNILQLPVKNLPATGQYDWTLVVRSETYGDICPQSGWFIAAGPASTRAEEDQTR